VAASTGGNTAGSSSSGQDSREPTYADEYGARDYTSEYLKEAAQQRHLRKAAEERIRAEAELHNKTTTSSATGFNPYTGRSDDPAEEVYTRVSEAARVKTQWEKTLNSSARGFLDDIHSDTARQREHSAEVYLGHAGSGRGSNNDASAGAESGQKRSAKEERLEMIRQKRSKSGLC
jgi:hypothetical protein